MSLRAVAAREMLAKLDTATMIEYARLLRWAWLNPSHGAAQDGVRAFERQHTEELDPLWTQWQKTGEENLSASRTSADMSANQKTAILGALAKIANTEFRRH